MYRFAPSPTGDMHIGNLRAAIFNYLSAKKEGKGFILRIEDTDKERNIKGKDEEIKELLRIFGLSWQHFYIQSANLKQHRQMALRLVAEKKAFACFCTSEVLEQKKEAAKKANKAYRYDGACEGLSDSEVLENDNPFVIRLKKPKKAMEFIDLIKGKLHFEPENIDSFVIMRADKTPTYNFACAVDDMIEGVSCIVRGEDHTSNTPKQEHIRASLGYESPMIYAHLPIILNEEGQKMSKREAHSSVKWLLEQGILPGAVANYLIMLGNKTPKEIFTLEEAVEFFDIKKLSRSPARFDMKKLLQINREHLKLLDDESLNELLGFRAENLNGVSKLKNSNSIKKDGENLRPTKANNKNLLAQDINEITNSKSKTSDNLSQNSKIVEKNSSPEINKNSSPTQKESEALNISSSLEGKENSSITDKQDKNSSPSNKNSRIVEKNSSPFNNINKNSKICPEFIGKNVAPLARFYTQEASTINELREKLELIFSKKQIDEFKEERELISQSLCEMNLAENYEDFKKALMAKTKLKGKSFFMPLRLVLTGRAHGPELEKLYPLIRSFIKEIARL
ncbi:glutamate--tRNA ligase [Campylobacter troglodytis]|nr:glutamate--tRNA ligase [Campylobacter troglodytis]